MGGRAAANDEVDGIVTDSPAVPANRRFDCASAYVLQCLGLLESIGGSAVQGARVRQALIERSFTTELLTHHHANVPPKIAAQATRLLCMLCEGSCEATERVLPILARRLELCLAHFKELPHDELLRAEAQLLCSLCSIQDEIWPRRLQLLFRVFFRAMAHLDSPLVCERLLLPCLRLIARLTLPTAPRSSSTSTAAARPTRPRATATTSAGTSQNLSGDSIGIPSLLPVSLRGSTDDSAAGGTSRHLVPPASSATRRLSGVRSQLSAQPGLGIGGGASALSGGSAPAAFPPPTSVGRAAQAPTQPSESGGSGPSAEANATSEGAGAAAAAVGFLARPAM